LVSKKKKSSEREGAVNMLEGDWTQERADALQKGVDDIFERRADSSDLGRLKFSFTIADPSIQGCPLIGCSAGFAELCGYNFDEIVGRNCKFLVDPVPPELVDSGARRLAREFCAAVAEGRDYRVPSADRRPWMPEGKPHEDGIFLVQTNARKDGSLFRNMFYLKPMGIEERNYIVGLQTSLDEGDAEVMAAAHGACETLDKNMIELEKLLAGKFWIYTSMRRQVNACDESSYGLEAQ